MLEEQEPDHESGLDPRLTLVAVERRNLAVDPRPVDLACELHQFMAHVDDLIESSSLSDLNANPLISLKPRILSVAKIYRNINHLKICAYRVRQAASGENHTLESAGNADILRITNLI